MAPSPSSAAALQPDNLADLDLSGLSPEEQAEACELAELLYGGEGLADFIRRVFPHEPPPPHLMPLIDAIERARRAPIRLCISLPPRHAKTVTILRAIVWWLRRTPADTCGYFSYNSTIAESKSDIARTLAQRLGLPLARTPLNEWRTLQGGGLLAGGVGGGLTGQGVSGFIVVDDPFKNREDADSAGYRQNVWEWFNEVVMTRLEKASVIVVHTRWHPDDLIGRLEAVGGWEIIRLPAIAEAPSNDNAEPDPLGRKPGEALWEERFPASELGTEEHQRGTVRGQMGEFSFAAIYQQNPRPRGAKLFNAAHYYDPTKFDLTGWRIVIGGDPSGTAKTSSDYAVAIALAVRGRGPDAEGRILKMIRGQTSVPQYTRDLRALQIEFGGAPVYVEAVAGFKAVPQLLREQDPLLIVHEAPTLGDKFQRAQPASAAWNSARLLVPLYSPVPQWMIELLHELKDATGVSDAYDDIMDALAHAWNGAMNVPEPPKFSRPAGAGLGRRR